MRFADAFSFRQKPHGPFKWLLRIPVWVFQARLGFLFGDRIVVIVDHGRHSGVVRKTAVEVVTHDRQRGEYIVCSGTGPHADWYLNLQAEPAVELWAGARRWHPQQRFLDDTEAERVFADYEHQHPKTAARLLRSMGNSYDGTQAGRLAMMAKMPMVAFTDS